MSYAALCRVSGRLGSPLTKSVGSPGVSGLFPWQPNLGATVVLSSEGLVIVNITPYHA